MAKIHFLTILGLAPFLTSALTNAQIATHVYVANEGASYTSVIDTATNTVIGTVPTGACNSVAVSVDGTRAYAGCYSPHNFLQVIDTATGKILTAVGLGASPGGITVTPDGSRVYVVVPTSNTVSVVDTATNKVSVQVNVGIAPLYVAITPNGQRAYVTNSNSVTVPNTGSVSVINTATNAVIATIPVGVGPIGVAISPDSSRAYVSNYFSNSVSVIDTTTNTVTTTVGVGAAPEGLAVSPDGKRVYVANINSNPSSVSVIDTVTNTVSATISPLGKGPIAVGVTPDSSRAYVANWGSGGASTVSVIDTAKNMVIATVNGFVGPHGVAAVPIGADLHLRLVDYPTPPTQGALLTYAFKIWNLGPNIATHEVLTTQVPPGTTFSSISISGTPGLGSCTHPAVGASGPVVCKEGSRMAPGTTWKVRMTVEVTAPAGTVITETAKASEDTFDPNLANNVAIVRNTVK